ncbi:MAG: hypothetical protein B0D96_03260 [Candidatus Sedimenticola endophacoides]|uniref:DUF692 domain-containing protein n=1 Tax=Candidatus Sedimenticola endophacoides TaxID=2548426 RepID=A0A6N4DZ26_9GAMM|nr:MAG: hypothetical protein B0D94_11830 [Candidatus Sedimenticola endophacoides]OQX36852.1 MAG: hypothetical protein B0D96_03260 [Candidatus Sedimenticola endophacoides]OQX40909.1 MAG: hypothetical protein B0D89_06165 [Candidatus Sedimenticola endophacoides]OQX49075.1 MAG: hypothetical protein B0D87_02320 [Candidatus Sedimenticola endophacoides]PUD99430.1 MAG: DUF692 domain-containing protein [Candidatus Sedimenticola endophacoides]
MNADAPTPPQEPFPGFGLRLRREYIPYVLESHPDVDWFEVTAEGFLEQDADTLSALERLRGDYPLVLHSLSLALGSPWPLDREYLRRLARLAERLRPERISGHLCWGGSEDRRDSLFPLPHSREMIDHLVPRIQQVQETLGQALLLENVPAEADGQEIPEAQFISEVAERSGSLILIDIENLLGSSVHQGFDPANYLARLPAQRVREIHLLGATALCEPAEEATPLPPDPVWELYLLALERLGPVATLIERIDTIPSLEEMLNEVARARCGASRHLAV